MDNQSDGTKSPPHGGLKIINASLFRMGTKSMALAYQELGFKTHHGLLEDVYDTLWSQIETAAEATWPNVPGAPSPPRAPFSRADWDALWGQYEAVTDIASPFSVPLIRAYPEVKVVIVQRDFDSWWPSFRTELRDKVLGQPMSGIQALITSRILGIRPVHAMSKVLLGFIGARNRLGINEESARHAYNDYFDETRRLVPSDRRLEYELGSGWGLLCTFLGVDIPNKPFPNANEKETHTKETNRRHASFIVNATKLTLPWLIGVGAIVLVWSYWRRGTY